MTSQPKLTLFDVCVPILASVVLVMSQWSTTFGEYSYGRSALLTGIGIGLLAVYALINWAFFTGRWKVV